MERCAFCTTTERSGTRQTEHPTKMNNVDQTVKESEKDNEGHFIFYVVILISTLLISNQILYCYDYIRY